MLIKDDSDLLSVKESNFSPTCWADEATKAEKVNERSFA